MNKQIMLTFKPFILWFAIPYGISTIILFLNIASAPYWFKIAYCLGIYFIWGIVGTFINVPYGAMVNSMTSNQIQRTELSNARSVGSLGANVITTTIAPLMCSTCYRLYINLYLLLLNL